MPAKRNNPTPSTNYTIEVPVLEVHRIMHFILFGNTGVKMVKYCNSCKMPNFTGSEYTFSLHCEVCNALWLNEESLREMKPEPYLQMLRKLPLRNYGKLFVTPHERVKLLGSPAITYDDLSADFMLELDKLAGI